MRAADALVRAIVTRGTRHVFTLSGNQIMSLFDAAIDVPLELIHVRHEAAAVHAADAIGRLSGRPGWRWSRPGPGSPTRCRPCTWRSARSRRWCCSPVPRRPAGRGPVRSRRWTRRGSPPRSARHPGPAPTRNGWPATSRGRGDARRPDVPDRCTWPCRWTCWSRSCGPESRRSSRMRARRRRHRQIWLPSAGRLTMPRARW